MQENSVKPASSTMANAHQLWTAIRSKSRRETSALLAEARNSIAEEIPDDADAAPRLLVVDTDDVLNPSMGAELSRLGYIVAHANSLSDVLLKLRLKCFRAVILEWRPQVGLTVQSFEHVARAAGNTPIIAVSAPDNLRDLFRCIPRGVVDVLAKPVAMSDLRAALSRVAPVREHSFAAGVQRWQDVSVPERRASLLIGTSHTMQVLREVVANAASNDLNCLIQGPSGAGKSAVAREIHQIGRRNQYPCVEVNCAALPPDLFESELFGFERGAFTGAVAAKPGRFELAHKGVIVLDEIAELPPQLQGKLLQVLDRKEFTKLGARRPTRVDVKIVATTSGSVSSLIRTGHFRSDLYYRLNEFHIEVPPLADHREDIPVLARHFAWKHHRSDVCGSSPVFPGELMERLVAYDWPGNVRELESTVKRWLVFGETGLHATLGDPESGMNHQDNS